jgi:uncharacterized membrane protein
MTLTKWVATYGVTLLVFLALDFMWLGLVAKGFYRRYLGSFFSEKVNWLAAFLFYLIFILGILVFAVLPGFKEASGFKALGMGMLFGLVTYATYDLTNLALLKGWPTKVVIVDMAWGTLLTGIVALAGYAFSIWIS